MSQPPTPDSNGSIASNLKSVSPSRYGALREWKEGRACALQMLWRGKAPLAPYPAAKLGDVVHRMLDRLPTGADEVEAKQAWDEALRYTECRLSNDWVTRGLLPLSRTVRRYSLKRILVIRGVLRSLPTIRHSNTDSGQFGTMREEDLQSVDGLLKGRADLLEYRGGEWVLVDYKSGEVHEDDGESGQRIKEEYAVQLRLYAHLIRETKGLVIRRALLRTLDGHEHEVAVDEASVRGAGAEARSLLAEFNNAAQHHTDPINLARPMAENWERGIFGCAGCLFRPLCPAYLACEKRWQVGERWPRDAWGQVTQMERTGEGVRIQIQNNNRLVGPQVEAPNPVVVVKLTDSLVRHPALSRIKVGADIQVFNFVAPRLGTTGQDGPRTCVYVGRCMQVGNSSGQESPAA